MEVMPAERDQAVLDTPLPHVASARHISPLEEQRTVDAATTAITTRSSDTRQCGIAKIVTSFYVTMGVTMTASTSITSNMDHLVWTKIISVANHS